MKYVVEWYITNGNEFSPEFDEYLDAREYAIFQSQLVGVSEAKIFDEEGELLSYFVDGNAYPIYEEGWEDECL